MRRYVLALVVFLAAAPVPAREPVAAVPLAATAALCNATGQKPAPAGDLAAIVAAAPGRFGDETRETVRVISLSPFRIQTLVGHPERHIRGFPTVEAPELRPEALAALGGLRFGDHIGVRRERWMMFCCGNSPGSCSDNHDHILSIEPAAARPAALVELRRGREQIAVFSDGIVQVFDDSTEILYAISEAELAQLLQRFAGAGFDGLAGLGEEAHAPEVLTLSCARQQRVDATQHRAALAEILAHLDGLRQRAMAESQVFLQVEAPRRVIVLDWPASVGPLADLHTHRSPDRLRDPGNPLYQPLPPELVAKLPPFPVTLGNGTEPLVLVRDQGVLYEVFHPRCQPDPRWVCQDDQFSSLHIPAPFRGRPWPFRRIKLKAIPAPGRVLTAAEVRASKGLVGPGHSWVLDGDRFYERVATKRIGRIAPD